MPISVPNPVVSGGAKKALCERKKMDVVAFSQLAEQAINYGIIPILFIFLVFYFVKQNQQLHRQNMDLVKQMLEIVRDSGQKNSGSKDV